MILDGSGCKRRNFRHPPKIDDHLACYRGGVKDTQRHDFLPLERSPPRIGILGAARIAPKALLAATSGLAEVVCVAARAPERAEAFAAAHGLPAHERSYEKLLERSDVDVVYIALPAALHAPWVERSLRAGKHVMCEKPFGLSVVEARNCVHLAQQQERLLMEAHHSCYHPLVAAFRKGIERVGRIERVHAFFHGPIQEGDIRLNPRLGAGVLLDFGCYLIQWQRLTTGDGAPVIEKAAAVQSPPGIDVSVTAILRTNQGVRVELECDMRPEVAFRAFIEVDGEHGRLRWENPLNGEDSRLLLELDGGSAQTTESVGPSTYRAQLQALVTALETGRLPLTSGANIIETQAQLDALVAASGLPERAVLAEQIRD